MPIPDLSTVESAITIADCPGTAATSATVAVHIKHTYIGDLIITLIAPDGSPYPLHNRTGGGTDDLDQTDTVNVTGEQRDGTWKLRVQDAAGADTGRIDGWSVNLATSTPTTCRRTNGTGAAIADLSTVDSPIAIADCQGNGSATATVEVHVAHTYIGDLIVGLVAPDGSTYPLHNRSGGSTDNLDQTYTVNLSAEPRNGTWKLRVQRRRTRRRRPHQLLDARALRLRRCGPITPVVVRRMRRWSMRAASRGRVLRPCRRRPACPRLGRWRYRESGRADASDEASSGRL